MTDETRHPGDPAPAPPRRRRSRVRRVVGGLVILAVALSAAGLVLLQTSWFKYELRDLIASGAGRFLNGRLVIGRVSGNLLSGITLHDVSLILDGQPAIVIPEVAVRYRLAGLVSAGRIVDEVDVDRPVIHLRDTAAGWNLAHLMKPRPPAKPGGGPRYGIQHILIRGGQLIITPPPGPGGRLVWPRRLTDLAADVAIDAVPGRVTFEIRRLSMRAAQPALDPITLSGRIALEPEQVSFGRIDARLAGSRFRIDGAVPRHGGGQPVDLHLSADPADLPALAHLVPALQGVPLSPAVTLSATGPLDRLAIDLDFQSRAGRIRARLVADARSPVRTATGDVRLDRVDLAPLLKRPAVRSDITATVHVAARLPAAGDPSATYTMQAPAVTVVGYRAAAMTAKGRVDRHGVRLNADGRAYGGRVTAIGTLTWPLRQGHRRVTFDLQGRAAGVDLSRLPSHVGVRKLDSSLNFDYSLTGEWPRLGATFALQTSTALGATIAGGDTGRFSLAGPALAYAAAGRVAHLDLQRIGRAFDLTALSADRYSTDLTGRFDLHVTGTRLREMTLEATGQLDRSRAFDGTAGDATLAAHLAGARLVVTAAGAFDRLDLAQVLNDPQRTGRLGGRLDGTVTFADVTAPLTVDNVSWNGRVDFVRSTIQGLTIDRASVDGRYRRRVAVVRRLTVEDPLLDGQASGRLDLGSAGASRLSFQVRRVDLGRAGALVGRPLSGQASASGDVTGNGRLLRLTGTLDGAPVADGRGGVKHLEARVDASLADLDVQKLRATAEVTAQDLTAADAIVARTATARLGYANRTIDFVTSLTSPAAGLDATGTWHLEDGRSTVRLSRLALQSGGLAWRLAPGSRPVLVFGGGPVSVSDVRLQGHGHELTAAGTLGEPGQGLDVHLREFDLRELDALLPRAPHLTGLADAQMTLTGTLEAPHVTGKLAVAQGGYGSIRDVTLAATGQYEAGRVVGLALRLEQPGGAWLTVDGGLPASLLAGSLAGSPGPAGALDLAVRTSPISLALLQGFTTAVSDVSGTFQAELQITGTPAQPAAHGYIDVHQGAMTVAAAGVRYTGLETRIALLGDRVHVDRLTILDPHRHTLQISGDVAVQAGRIHGVRADVRADRFEVLDSALAHAVVSSDVRLTGDLLHPRLDGTVSLDRAKLDADRLLDLMSRGTTEAQPVIPVGPARMGPPAPEPSAFVGLAMDLTIHVPDDLAVSGADLTRSSAPIGVGSLSLVLGGTVRLLKDPGGAVRLAGVMNTVSGAYGFQGRRFDIQRGGQIQFQGLQPIDPTLDISARRDISGVQTQVNVQGTLRRPRLVLTSTPPLDEADILALIVFNQPLNQLGEQQQSSLVSRAGAIAAGALTSSLAQSIGRALDLDVLEVQPAPSTGATAALTIGQQIGSRLFLKVQQSIGRESATQFTIDYLLTGFMRLQSSIAQGSLVSNPTLVSQTQRGGIDLIFFFSY
ncbi:MAG TPA: translocation/assembly module TamB domain-containing protein [Vicinamibacterales bacterium]|nr:translocation/assembly module TamB domain-containing protein [Vicinamibacterales bacterium]